MANMIVRILQKVGVYGRLEFIPPFNFGGNKLQGVANGVDPTDAVNKGQLDEAIPGTGFLKADGSVKATGDLDIDSHKIENVTAGASAGDAVNFGQLSTLQEQVNGIETDQLADTLLSTIRIGKVRLNADGKARVKFKTATPATLLGSEVGPFDLTGVGNGGTIIVNPDGSGNQTVTINFAAGNHVGGASAPTDMTAQADNKFKIRANGDEVWHTVECDWVAGSCDSGAEIAAEMQRVIRLLGATYGYDTIIVGFADTKYTITSAQLGTGSKIEISRADDHDCCDDLKIGPNGTSTDGTGDVANAVAATAAELALVINTDLEAQSIIAEDDGDALRLTSQTVGATSSLVMGNSTLKTVLGLAQAATDYGSQALGYASDMENTSYVVTATITATAQSSLASKNLSITNLAVTGFVIECEDATGTDYVFVMVAGLEEVP